MSVKIFFAPLLIWSVILLFCRCGPAAEDREMMYARARVFQDSIANVIRAPMNEAEQLTSWAYQKNNLPVRSSDSATAHSSAPKNK